MNLSSGSFDNQSGGQIQSGTDLAVSAATLDNEGTVNAKGNAVLSGSTLSNATTGQLLAAGALTVGETGSVSNAGVLQAGSDVTVTQATSLTNAAGATLYAGQDVNLALHQSLTNAGMLYAGRTSTLSVGNVDNTGTLRSGGNLSLTSAGDVTSSGAIQAQQALTLLGGADVTNSGKLYAIDGALTAQTAGVFSSTSTGDIYSGEAIGYQVGSFANAGTLEATQGINIVAQGNAGNSGVLQADHGDVVVTASSLANQGTLSANGNVQASASGALTNAGKVVANSALILTGATLGNSGQMQSAGNTTLQAAAIDNSGRLQSGGTLMITHNATLTNEATGLLLAAGDFSADTSSLLSNAGVIQSGGNVSVDGTGGIDTAADSTLYGAALTTLQLGGGFTNAGTVYGGQGVQLAAASVGNTGVLRSDATLNVATQGNAGNSGTAYAVGNAGWNVAGTLTNTGVLASAADTTLAVGSLAGNGTLAAGLQGNGALGSSGALAVTATGSLASQGRALAAGNLTFTGQAIDLTGSQTRAGSNLTVSARQGDVVNAGGNLATNGTVSIITPGSLINGGTTAAQGGHISGATLNLTAASLDNQYGTLIQTGTGDLALAFVGAFENAYGTLASNAGNLRIQAASLDNTGGTLQQAGSGVLTLDANGNLTNTHGQIAGNGALNLQSGGTLANNGGTLSVAGNATVNAVNINDSQGTLIADTLLATATQAFTNTAGTVQAAGALTLNAGSLDNTGGYIKVTDAQALGVTTSGSLTNGASGFIGGNGAVTLQAGSLTNAGQIYAGQALGATVQGALTNDGGALQAMSSLSATSGGALSNRSGQIEAGAGDGNATLGLTAANIDNTGGRIADSGHGSTTVNGNQGIVNQGGTLGGQGAVALTAASMDNSHGGHLVAGQNLGFAFGGMNNASGTVYAAGSLTWNNSGASLANVGGNLGAGGDLSLTLQSLDDTGGALAANGNAALTANTVTALGRVAAGQNLTLTTGGSYTNTSSSQLVSNGNLTLNLGGSFSNVSGATLQAVGTLAVSASSIDNAAGATLNSAATTLTTGGALTNEGSIEGNTITLNAGSLTNTGNIIGGTLVATAGSLTNGADLGATTSNNPYQSALIAGSNSIALYVGGTLLNRDATIFTTGDLTIAANPGGGQAQAVTNLSGDIESDGSITLDANQFTNQRRVFQTTTYNLTAAEQAQNTATGAPLARYLATDTDPNHQPPNVTAAQVIGSAEFANATAYCNAHDSDSGRCVGYPNGVGAPVSFQSVSTDTVTSVTKLLATSAQGQLLASGDITLNGSVLNDKSTIAAGNNLIINGQNGSAGGGNTSTATVQNVAWAPTAQVTESTQDQTAWQYLQNSPRTWIDGGWWTYGTTTGQQQISLAPGAAPSWVTYNAGAGLAASMSAGNTVSITAQTINNTVVNASGQPVQAAIGLGSNSGAQSVGGSAAGTVGQASGAGGSVGGVAVGSAPGQVSGGSLGLATARTVDGAPAQGTTSAQDLGPAAASTPAGSHVTPAASGNTAAPAAPQVVSTLVGPNATVRLPQTGLYTINVQPGSQFLVETNPQFTQYNSFISSNYLLQQLGLNPAATEQRLGDGFYEQQQVLAQITDLTGRRYLADDTDALDQYRDLMNNATQVAKQFDLSVGVALTPEQMASLTQDIVWLVSVNVDGHQVLEPVVYLSAADAKNLAARGATIAGKNVILTASGDITNNGSIAASQNAQLTASNLLNSGTISAGNNLSINAAQNILNGGTISAGGNVSLVAGNDVLSGVNVAQSLGSVALAGLGSPVGTVALSNLSLPGSIHAGGDLSISAGRDLTLDTAPVAAGANLSLAAGRDLTATATAIHAGGDAQLLAGRDLSLLAIGSTNRIGTPHDSVETTTHTVDTLAAGGTLSLLAGHDLASQGAQLTGATLALAAGHDVNLQAVTDSTTRTSQSIQGHTVINAGQTDQSVRGTTLTGSNGLGISAGHDLTVTAGQLNSANGNVALAAGHDLNLAAAQEDHSSYRDTVTSHSSLLSSSKTTTHDATSDSYAIGTTVSGNAVTMAAGHDLTTQAAQVAATHDVLLAAGHDLTIGTGENTHTEAHSVTEKKSGLSGGGGASGLGGIGFTVGSSQASASRTVEQHTTTGSLIGSTEGNVTLAAGGDLSVIGSDLIASRAAGASSGGNIALQGQNITITAAAQTDHETSSQSARSHGFSMALVGTPLDGIRNVEATRDERAGGGKKTEDTLNAIGAMAGDTPGIAAGYGSSRSNASSELDSTTERGSTLRAAGDLTLNATGGDLTVIGSALSAGGTATLEAQHDVALLTSVSTESQSSQNSSHSSSVTVAPYSWGDIARHLQGGPNHSGVSMSGYNGQSGNGQSTQQTISETATTVDAGQINVISRQGNITAEGAQLTAQHDLDVLAAQGNINLGSGEAIQTWQSQQSGHQIGDLGGNGYAGTIGERQEQHDQNGQQTWQSTLRTGLTSTQGDVNVTAHGDLTGQGVDIAGRDVTLVGSNVALLPSVDSVAQQQSDKVSQVGVTVALSGAAVQAAQAADGAVAAHDQGDHRLSTLYAAEAAYGVKDSSAAAQGQGSNSLVKVTVSIGGGHQSSTSSYQSQTQEGSTVTASRDLTIVATGSGAKGADGYATDGDILLQGAQVQAGRNASLMAARDIDLLSSQDTTAQSSQNHSSNASVGVGFALGGQQNGFTLELAAAAAKGQGNGDGTTQHATTVTAGDTLSLVSGRDTRLDGAQAKGQTILADVGRNLTLTSTQDSNHYTEKDQSASAGLSLCIPPFCYGTSSGGASVSQTDISNHFQSVTDQTGLAAGSGGFDIHVGGTTALTGAAIASTAAPDRNLLDTGHLTVANLHNVADSSASQVGVSFNTGGSIGSNLVSNGMGTALNLAVPQGGNHSGDTVSSIAPGAIVVRNDPGQDLSGIDRSAATLAGNGVSNTFDLNKVKEQQALGQAAGYVGMRAAGDIADMMQNQAAQDLATAGTNGDSAGITRAQDRLAAWSAGGVDATLLHGLVGAVSAKLGGGNAAQGALGAAAGEAASGVMTDYLVNHGIAPDSSEGKTLMQLASTAIGGAIAGGAGAATALQGEKYNRQLHPAELSLIVGTLAKQYADDYNAAHPDATISERDAETILIEQALRQVDNTWASKLGGDDGEARAWLQEHTAGLALSNGEEVFTATGAEKNDWNLYAQPYKDQYINSHMSSLNYGLGDPNQFGMGEYTDVANQVRDQATLNGLYAKVAAGQGLTSSEISTVENLQFLKPILSLTNPLAAAAYGVADGKYAQSAGQLILLALPAAGEAGAFELGVSNVAGTVDQSFLYRGVLGNGAGGRVALPNGWAVDMEAGGVSQYDQFRFNPETLTPQQIANSANSKVAPWDWPENNGAMSGTTVNTTLKAGDVVDRIGYTTGNFLAPVGTSLSGRALAPGSFADPYNQYVVLKPFVVEESEVAPAFGELGQEVQFKIPDAQPGQKVTVQDLIDKDYLGLK